MIIIFSIICICFFLGMIFYLGYLIGYSEHCTVEINDLEELRKELDKLKNI